MGGEKCLLMVGLWNQLIYSVLEMVLNYYDETHGSKGIIKRPINWCTSPMMIYKITPSIDYN